MEYPVVAYSEYERQTAPHVKEWAIFGALCLVPTMLALSSWVVFQVSYSHGLKKGSAVHNVHVLKTTKSKKK